MPVVGRLGGIECGALCRCVLACMQWKHNPEGGACPFAAFDRDVPSMPLDDLLDDMEPQPKAAQLRAYIRCPIKQLKQVGLRILGNPDARIRDL